MARGFNYIRPFDNKGEYFRCNHCNMTKKHMLKVRAKGQVKSYCRECFDSLALIATTYFNPHPSVYMDHGRTPEEYVHLAPAYIRMHIQKVYLSGKRIQAIKDLRCLLDCGLKEAKYQCDWWGVGNLGWYNEDVGLSYMKRKRNHHHEMMHEWREIQKRNRLNSL